MLKTYTPKAFLKHLLKSLFWICAILYFLSLNNAFFVQYSDKNNGIVSVGIDFNAYLTGASVLRENPKLLYDEKTQIKHQKDLTKEDTDELLSFRNTPFVAWINLPYTLRTPRESYATNYLIQTTLVLFFILYIRRLINIKTLFLPIFFFFSPVIFQPLYGQISIFIAFLYALILSLIRSNKYLLSGVVSSLFMLKFQYLIAIPYLLIFAKDRKRFLAGMLISGTILIAIDSLIYGSFYLPDYIHFLFRTENYTAGTNTFALYNLMAFVRILKIPDMVGYVVSITLLLATLLVTWVYRKKITPETFIASLILWNISITPHSALVDLIFLLIPISIFIKTPGKLSKIFAGVLFLIPLTCYVGLQGPAGIVLFIIGCINLVAIKDNSAPDISRVNKEKISLTT